MPEGGVYLLQGPCIAEPAGPVLGRPTFPEGANAGHVESTISPLAAWKLAGDRLSQVRWGRSYLRGVEPWKGGDTRTPDLLQAHHMLM